MYKLYSQNKGKEIEEITVGQAHGNFIQILAVFINQKRVNVCEHTTKMMSLLYSVI